jgi:acyl-CoA synthetase (AMP-forming)/AMP-acid ligase II
VYNVFDLLPYQARVRPDAPFLWEPERIVTYGELLHRVNGLRARLLDAGLQAHDRVLIRTSDELVYVALTLASWAENLVTVPVEHTL